MYYLENLINSFFDTLLYEFFIPLIFMIDEILKIVFSPVINKGPLPVVVTCSIIAGISSFLLSKYFKDKNTKKLNKELSEKISSLRFTDEIDDKDMKLNLKKGINDEADKIYENILMDKFINMGITYLFPMFFFLIWLDYSLFPAANGKNYSVNILDLSIPVSFSFIIIFNLSILGIYIFKKNLYRLR